jgi:hypothetical protein
MSMRKRFGLSEPETSLSDQLIVANTATRSVALFVNSVIGVLDRTTLEVIEAEKIVPGAQYVEGITRLEGGILFIHDLGQFLSAKEEQQLCGLLTQAAGRIMTKKISDAQLLQLGDVVARHLGLHFPKGAGLIFSVEHAVRLRNAVVSTIWTTMSKGCCHPPWLKGTRMPWLVA